MTMKNCNKHKVALLLCIAMLVLIPLLAFLTHSKNDIDSNTTNIGVKNTVSTQSVCFDDSELIQYIGKEYLNEEDPQIENLVNKMQVLQRVDALGITEDSLIEKANGNLFEFETSPEIACTNLGYELVLQIGLSNH